MNSSMTVMVDQFENERTGEMVEGVTIIVDGVLKQFLDVVRSRSSAYPDNATLIQDALFRGLNDIKDGL
ncbi:hypothetical protein FYJ24_07325 [Actinomycetaceae bacterium WB03_NA08]|uniref:Uncharacterized protein n=1 Tax=Scrofimicrobium canadense TaxID=2652290 RepID=A0A6N7W5I5_9ACTO|nr:hypothetical protein [Scrofimicrobium canadense]MSS84575.1 hypothetical protein [Scrofimicrobium canadense]